MSELGITKKIGFMEVFNPIESNEDVRCLDCGINITYKNNSGWEGFTKKGYTQPLCKNCDNKRNINMENLK